MSSLAALYGALGHAKGGGAALSLLGEIVIAFNLNSDASAEIILRDDGTVDRGINGVFTQVDAATDWIIPNGDAPAAYQARYTNRTGSILTNASAAEDTYRAFSLGSYFTRNTDQTVAAGGLNSTFDLEIRDGAGPVLASGSYRLDADREDF